MSHRAEREVFVNFSEIYLPTPLVIMRRTNDDQPMPKTLLASDTVALVKGYSSSKSVLSENPGIKTLIVKTALDGLFAVATGKADAYVGVLGINLYLARQNGILNLEVASLYGAGTNGQRFGVRKDWPELATIIDKLLSAMPESEKIKLFEPWLPERATGLSAQEREQLPIYDALTEDERLWLKKHPSIKIAINSKWPPMDFVDDKGDPNGIGVGFIQALNLRLGNILHITPGPWKQNIRGCPNRATRCPDGYYPPTGQRAAI